MNAIQIFSCWAAGTPAAYCTQSLQLLPISKVRMPQFLVEFCCSEAPFHQALGYWISLVVMMSQLSSVGLLMKVTSLDTHEISNQ